MILHFQRAGSPAPEPTFTMCSAVNLPLHYHSESSPTFSDLDKTSEAVKDPAEFPFEVSLKDCIVTQSNLCWVCPTSLPRAHYYHWQTDLKHLTTDLHLMIYFTYAQLFLTRIFTHMHPITSILVFFSFSVLIKVFLNKHLNKIIMMGYSWVLCLS